MKILTTGNMGYVGPAVVKELRHVYEGATLIGFDNAYFAHCLTNAGVLPESLLDTQHFGDVRSIAGELFEGVDAVVQLSAISNDPMGAAFAEVTAQINCDATLEVAKKAKAAGVRHFVFASSCSVYGAASDGVCDERSPVDPLTAYAKSKVDAEVGLRALADPRFIVSSLRFATACGMSPRLRLDLVLNDFVASAVLTKKIEILSDGSPWRPLINTRDMARAIRWAIRREILSGGEFLAVNVGSNGWNYRVKELAESVAHAMPGTSISVNPLAAPDKRSYRVRFDLFSELAPDAQPECGLDETVRELQLGLGALVHLPQDFRASSLMRLRVLRELRDRGLLDDRLAWVRAALAPPG